MTIQRTTRDILQRKLLASLEDDDAVAIVLTQADLEFLIAACEHYAGREANLVEAMKELYQAAFGKKGG